MIVKQKLTCSLFRIIVLFEDVPRIRVTKIGKHHVFTFFIIKKKRFVSETFDKNAKCCEENWLICNFCNCNYFIFSMGEKSRFFVVLRAKICYRAVIIRFIAMRAGFWDKPFLFYGLMSWKGNNTMIISIPIINHNFQK